LRLKIGYTTKQVRTQQKNNNKTIAFQSIGCRTNQEELHAIQCQCAEAGYTIVTELSLADIIVVNTCAVTAHTESKVRRLLHSFSRIAPQARLVLTGCLVQLNPSALLQIKNVDLVVGNREKDNLLHLISSAQKGMRVTDISVENDTLLPGQKPSPLTHTTQKTRFSLKIQEGCDAS